MSLPLTPGVYIMKNAKKDIIYIGKAKALRNRVSQYFGSQNNHSVKVRKMVSNVDDFDYILVGSESEAFLLECSLIKQHKPKYNILLKDDKGYYYVRVTRGDWRTLSSCMQKTDDDADYYGPYTSSDNVSKAVDEARSVFRLPVCGKVFPRDINRNGRPCLNYFIKLCTAPCCGKVNKEDYEESVDEALKFIIGGSAQALRSMKSEMLEASENLEFEKAAKLRDRIAAIEKTSAKKLVYSNTVKTRDVFAIAHGEEKSCLAVLRFTDGHLTDSESFITDSLTEPDEDRTRLILDYYSMRDFIPQKINIDSPAADVEALESILSEKLGKKVSITVPERGEAKSLINMCAGNALDKLSKMTGRAEKQRAVLEELRECLGLSVLPEYIESYDISHTSGNDVVGGMIVYSGGKPLKRAYKRFSIKSFEGQDDTRAMAEVLERRFGEYEKSDKNGEGFGRMPDLILLDGALGQVHAVKAVLADMGITVPVFGMVKDGRHRTRAITSDGGETVINDKRAVFTLVSGIQEEVHRFAIAYHRAKRGKNSLVLKLTEIDGVGEKRAQALLKRFGSVAAIREAGYDELCKTAGITTFAAKSIVKYFENEKNNV